MGLAWSAAINGEQALDEIAPDLKTVASDLRFPEGPVALPDGSCLVVEIAAPRLTRIYPDGKKEIVARLEGGPNGAAIGPDGACYICNNGGLAWREHPEIGLIPTGEPEGYVTGWIERVDLSTGEVTRLFDHVGEHPLKGPNDIVFDETGGFWFTDMGKIRSRDIDHGGVYYASAAGDVREVIYPISTANGIGLSADETRLYVAETSGARIWEFALKAPGEIARAPFPPSTNGGRARPSCCVSSMAVLVCAVGCRQAYRESAQ